MTKPDGNYGYINALIISQSIPEDSIRYLLTTDIIGAGTITPTSGEYIQGSNVSLIANPASGWKFTGWSGDFISDTSSIEIVMDQDKHLMATFEMQSMNLSVEIIGKGTVTTQTGPSLCDTEVSVQCIPETDWIFDHWEGALSGTDSILTLTMDAEKHLIAVFSLKTGIYSAKTRGGIEVYPVPFHDDLYLRHLPDQSMISVFNLTGSKMMEFEHLGNTFSINMSHLLPGIYLIRVFDQKNLMHYDFKVIKN